jgi:putative PIN family toxin of toxin-antitoxin system
MSPEAAPGRHGQRVVLDSNVWISAALNREGTPALVVRRVLERGIPVFSVATFTELETRLWRSKFDRYLSMELRQRILHDASAAALWVEIPRELAARTWSRDPDDDHFLRAAVAAEASWLVSGDGDLLGIDLPFQKGNPLRIVSPAQAIAEPDFCA